MILNHRNQSQAHPFFCMGGRSLQNPDFELYDKIVKDVIMVIFKLNRTQTTLLKCFTSPDCKGMNSRAFFKKVENKPKLRFSKSRQNSNHASRTDKNFMRVLLEDFLIKIECPQYLFVLFILCLFGQRTINLKVKIR